MTRVSAFFSDRKAAFAAVQALVAASFSPEDLQLRALRPDGSQPSIPVRVQSHIVPGFFIGGLVGFVAGLLVGLTSAGAAGVTSFGALGAGVGATGGAAIGIGSWAVVARRASVPADAEGFVVIVTIPEGRAAHARTVLEAAGGAESAPRLVPPS